MPCFTGRSNHILLKKDCKSGCACCYNHTYSCGLFEKEQNNSSLPDISAQVCNLIIEYATAECNNGLFWTAVPEDFLKFPERHCPLRIEQLYPSANQSVVIDYINREVVPLIQTLTPPYTGQIIYNVNGIECFRCDAVISVP